MDAHASLICSAFAGTELIAAGPPADVAAILRSLETAADDPIILVFDDATSHQLEFDLRGSVDEVREKYATRDDPEDEIPREAESPTRKPGRPRLGVVGREVTLLPRHWEWLSGQPGGASVALRRLVEQARRDNEKVDRLRHAQEAAFRFMSAMVGNEAGYEAAVRALYADDQSSFEENSDHWPTDVRSHARALAARAFEVTSAQAY